MGLFDKRRREKAMAAARTHLQEFDRLRDAERLHTAVPQLRAAKEQAAAALGERHDLTLHIQHYLGQALAAQGRGEEAVLEFRALADAAGRDPGSRVAPLAAASNVAAQLCYLERFEEAETQARQILVEVGKLPAFHRPYAKMSVVNNIARALIGLNRPAEAEQAAREALAEAAANAHLPTGSLKRIFNVNLASALSAQHRYTEALKALDAAAMISDPSERHAGDSAIAKARATALLGLGRQEEAAQAAEAGLRSALIAFGEPHARVRELRALLARAEAGSR
jgi:tetratricopeptide (TPR) repeat protein